MKGLFLQGGGAKGAFQAGVIYGLYEKGMHFEVLSGTSIGAINSYFIYTENIEKMKEVWTNIDTLNFELNVQDDKIIDNCGFIKALEQLKGKDERIKASFVNYVEVEGSNLKEVIIDITKLNKKDSLDSIKYSALLPGRIDSSKNLDKLIEEFNSKKVFDEFKMDLANGLYDGYKLDGGIVNNSFLNPFVNNKVDKLYIITFIKGYRVPEYILKSYNINDIIIIEPHTDFSPSDTMRFKKEFCKNLFYEGYETSKNI